VTYEEVQSWLDAYVEAWRSYEPAAIGDLFADGATYAYHPYDDPIRGREEIVSSWLEDPDDPASWEAEYRPLMVDGDRAVAVGESRYATGDVYSNLWVLRFDGEGRCAEFVEWYVKHPRAGASA
jgi:hypothetical protein